VSYRKVYVGRTKSHIGDRITRYAYLDADDTVIGVEIVLEAERGQPDDREPLVLELDE